MTVWTIEAEVPSKFPPVRLFLDDIEEIVRIFIKATETKDAGEVCPPVIRLTVKDRVCDDVQDLPKIAKKTGDLSIFVGTTIEYAPSVSLSFSEFGSRLNYISVMPEDEGFRLALYNKLAPIFKRRSQGLHAVVWSNFWLLIAVLLGTFSTLSMATVTRLFVTGARALPMWIPAGALVLMCTILLAQRYRYHSVIIMRNSSEPSPFRQGLPQKILLLAAGSIVTFFLTELGSWLKHKYWP